MDGEFFYKMSEDDVVELIMTQLLQNTDSTDLNYFCVVFNHTNNNSFNTIEWILHCWCLQAAESVNGS